MKRIYRKVFKSKEPSLGSIHGRGPPASTSASTGTTDLMPSIPACDSDRTTSAHFTAGVSVRVLASPFASLSIDLLLSSRAPVI